MTPAVQLVDPVHVTIRPNVQVVKLPSGERRHRVKWRVAGADRTRSYERVGEAQEFRDDLKRASSGRHREMFDRVTGLPESMLLPESGDTVLELSIDLLEAEWSKWSPGNRRGRVEALADLVSELVGSSVGRPDRQLARRVARDYLLPIEPKRLSVKESRIGGRVYTVTEQQKAMAWLRAHSASVTDLASVLTVEKTLRAVAVSPSGAAYQPDTLQRSRSSLSLLCGLAVKRDLLSTNPVRDARREVDDEEEEVDPAFVPTPEEARALVAALVLVSPHAAAQYHAYLTLLWTTGMRPSEASGILHNADLVLPEIGWGRVTLRKPMVHTGERWTSSGEAHEDRPKLKGRRRKATRVVLLPPETVAAVRRHLEDGDVKRGERVFTNSNSSPIDPSALAGVWRKVRVRAFEDGRFEGLRVYDLRHCAASTMLKAGIPVPRVAQQLGNSPATLMRVYARVMSTDDQAFTDAMDNALGGS